MHDDEAQREPEPHASEPVDPSQVWRPPPPMPPGEHGGPAAPDRVIDFDLQCRGCGGNLRSLTLADCCLVCGFRVSSSAPLSMLPPPVRDDALTRHSPTRAWTALTVAPLAVVTAWITAGVVFAMALLLTLGGPPTEEAINEWIRVFPQTPVGLLTLIVPGQLVFAGAAIFAALLSPIALHKRLALTRGRMPLWTWGVFLLAAPAVQLLVTYGADSVLPRHSEHAEMMDAMIRGFDGGFIIVAALLIGLAPGFAEELLFRGYMQSRLTKCWNPAMAIAASSLLFAIAHFDGIHAAAVLPIGVWFGLIAWRTGTIWPAMICHAGNNVLAVAMIRMSQPGAEVVEVPNWLAALFIASGLAFLVSIVLLVVYPRKGKAAADAE